MSEKEDFIRRFREVQPKFSRFYTRILTHANLSLPQFALLSLLAADGALSMTEVSAKLHISKPAVTNLADRLEKTHRVKRVPHPKDRRISLLRILPKGEKTVHKMQSEVLGFLLKTFEELSVSERKVITRFYSLISKTIDDSLIQPGRQVRIG